MSAGGFAPMTEDGYQQVAALNDDLEMGIFAKRLLDSRGLEATNTAELDGLVQWYSGSRAKQSLEAMVSELSSKPWVQPTSEGAFLQEGAATGLGNYRIVFKAGLPVTQTSARDSAKVGTLTEGDVATIVGAQLEVDGRLRVPIEKPRGWISLTHTITGEVFAEPVPFKKAAPVDLSMIRHYSKAKDEITVRGNWNKDWMNQKMLKEVYGPDFDIEQMLKTAKLEKRTNPNFPDKIQYNVIDGGKREQKHWFSESDISSMFQGRPAKGLLQHGLVLMRKGVAPPHDTEFITTDLGERAVKRLKQGSLLQIESDVENRPKECHETCDRGKHATMEWADKCSWSHCSGCSKCVGIHKSLSKSKTSWLQVAAEAGKDGKKKHNKQETHVVQHEQKMHKHQKKEQNIVEHVPKALLQQKALPDVVKLMKSPSSVMQKLHLQLSMLKQNLAVEESDGMGSIRAKDKQYQALLDKTKDNNTKIQYVNGNLSAEVDALKAENAGLRQHALELRKEGKSYTSQLTLLQTNLTSVQDLLVDSMATHGNGTEQLLVLKELQAKDDVEKTEAVRKQRLKSVGTKMLAKPKRKKMALLQVENSMDPNDILDTSQFLDTLGEKMNSYSEEQTSALDQLKSRFEEESEKLTNETGSLLQGQTEIEHKKEEQLQIRQSLKKAISHLEKAAKTLKSRLNSARIFLTKKSKSN